MTLDRVEGKVAAILGTTRVVLTMGGREGVKKGDRFYLFSVLGPFFHPDTDEELGSTIDVLAVVSAQIVEERFCIAQSEMVNNLAALLDMQSLFPFGSRRKQLPVNTEDIMPDTSNVTIGMLAVLEPRPTHAIEANPLIEEAQPEALTDGTEDVTETNDTQDPCDSPSD